MNYLAHAYLSFNDPEILAGNMISDFVKGKTKFTYPAKIQKGMALHRLIDQFTDDHPVTKAAKVFFKPAYRLYSGAFVDVAYDHFLAIDVKQFPLNTSLQDFSQNVYRMLRNNLPLLPPVFQKMLPHMETQNWLCNYQYKWGIEKGFGGLVYRATYLYESGTAFSIFNTHYGELKNCYEQFFPELKQFTALQLNALLKNESI